MISKLYWLTLGICIALFIWFLLSPLESPGMKRVKEWCREHEAHQVDYCVWRNM